MDSKLVLIAPALPQPLPLDASALIGHWLAGRSPTTVAEYSRDLSDFARRTGSADAASAVGRLLACRPGEANAMVLTYRNVLIEEGYAAATVNRRLASIRSVVALGQTLGLVEWSIGIEGIRPEPRRDVRGPDKAARKKLWRELRAGDSPRDRRDRAVIATPVRPGIETR